MMDRGSKEQWQAVMLVLTDLEGPLPTQIKTRAKQAFDWA